MFYDLPYSDIKSNGRFNETSFPTNDIVVVVVVVYVVGGSVV